MGKEHKKRPARTNEETAFEWGDFARDQPFWLIEEQKQAKEKETKQKEPPF
ncbi:hypothetical protein GK0941 [Geobacillus kaustophilus HTA426]|uniref:Uncharacterized protein n=1 Tax=Geobacillus kaustophilus (strain HTA426) TaxID=235909 RepID=Q5L1F4_GEOKA|nr:hypothetical protein [Geobacillus kaustophilus]BAD75226.1 hypothetical protein GK0941 [Geobacillus kaustophilus HTA426]